MPPTPTQGDVTKDAQLLKGWGHLQFVFNKSLPKFIRQSRKLSHATRHQRRR